MKKFFEEHPTITTVFFVLGILHVFFVLIESVFKVSVYGHVTGFKYRQCGKGKCSNPGNNTLLLQQAPFPPPQQLDDYHFEKIKI